MPAKHEKHNVCQHCGGLGVVIDKDSEERSECPHCGGSGIAQTAVGPPPDGPGGDTGN